MDRDVESAVRALPETTLCTADLYLTLLELNLAMGGRVAVVESSGTPAAVLGIRREGRLRWKNFANLLLPGLVGFAHRGVLVHGLAALHKEIVVDWFGVSEPHSDAAVRTNRDLGENALRVGDREAFWRSSSMWRTIVNARNRCAHLELSIDEPGAAEWVIREAGRKWSGQDADTSDARFIGEARIEITRSLAQRGRQVTLLFRDGARRVVGSTNYLDGTTCHAGVLFRDDSLGTAPTGVYAIASLFDFAAENGLDEVNLGTSSPYKARWAPLNGTAQELVIAPAPLHFVRRLSDLVCSRFFGGRHGSST